MLSSICVPIHPCSVPALSEHITSRFQQNYLANHHGSAAHLAIFLLPELDPAQLQDPSTRRYPEV